VEKLENINLLKELSDQLQEMEKVRKVDKTVLKTIDKLLEGCHSTESFWRDNKKESVQNSFMLYHASRNVRIILQKMKQRFLEAEEKHENPVVVEDSIAIIPTLSEVCVTISSLVKQTLTKDLVKMVSEKVQYLRDVALANSLLPTPEEEIQELDEKRLKKRFSEFAGTLQAMYV
jgi:hypothetical protein